MVNTHWGGVVEPNTFGTHEYFELLHQLDAEAYVNGNVGSGTVARDGRLGRVHDPRHRLSDGGPAQAPRARSGVPARVLRRRQRELGMRRQHAAAALREPLPAVPDLRAQVRRALDLEDRVRGELRRLRVDRGAHGARGRPHGRPEPALLHAADRRVGREGRGHRVRRPGLARDDPPHPLHGRAAHPARRDHGPPRSRAPRRASSSTSGAPGTTSSPAPRPGSCTSRTRSATRSPRPSTCTSSTSTPPACAWPTSRRWSTCCRACCSPTAPAS